MNQRIQELADEAAKFSAIMALPTGESGDKLFVEKFAELIVRECVNSIENTIETDCITDSEKMGCEFAITDLMKHFGVEE